MFYLIDELYTYYPDVEIGGRSGHAAYANFSQLCKFLVLFHAGTKRFLPFFVTIFGIFSNF